MIELYLVRHAIAEDRSCFLLKGLDDSLRPLTPEGRCKFQRIAKRLKKLIGPIDVIVTSPYLRAHQTAKLLQKTDPQVKILTSEALTPSSSPLALTDWCQTHLVKKMKKIVLVGHEPDLGLLASWLLCGSETSKIDVKKGGAIALSLKGGLEPSSACLKWLVTPKSLGVSSAKHCAKKEHTTL
jgi:phosphohistidine phosphatase